MSTTQQLLIGNLQLFGRILLKQFLSAHSNIQHQLHSSHQAATAPAALMNESSLLSTTTAISTTSSFPATVTLLSSMAQYSSSSSSILALLLPELVASCQGTAGRRTLPVASSSQPQVSILTPSSLHKRASTYALPLLRQTISIASDAVTNATPLPISSLNGIYLSASTATSALFFPGTCHRSAYLVFVPDPDSDLVLDLKPLIDGIFRDRSRDYEDSQEDDIEDMLTIYLFEEDEVADMQKRNKYNWTITIPRPTESAALPRPRVRPGQERERGKGWSRRWRQDHHFGWETEDSYADFGLRHWIAVLNKGTLSPHKEKSPTLNQGGTDEWLRTETFETEPRIASLVRSLNKLDVLIS